MKPRLALLISGILIAVVIIIFTYGLVSYPKPPIQPHVAHIIYRDILTANQQAFHNKLEAILATDLNIQGARDEITMFDAKHLKVWGVQEQNEYRNITAELTALLSVRYTLIAQYDALAEAPTTKGDRESCLPTMINEQEDIAHEIALINGFCA